jgi:formiminotetrahydrofolate cyclodeaminase
MDSCIGIGFNGRAVWDLHLLLITGGIIRIIMKGNGLIPSVINYTDEGNANIGRRNGKMGFSQLKIDDFLNRLASDAPTPGGGSAAAISGAMASGLLCMVANLTIGKEKYRDHWNEAKEVLNESLQLKDKFLALADQDAAAFDGVICALRMQKDTPAQREQRAADLQRALKKAAQSPMEIAEGCARVLALAWRLHDKCNPNALSDIGVAAHMAYAGMEGAIMNVRVNIPMIKDAEYTARLAQQMEIIRKEANKTYRNIIANMAFGE